jgi:hypothetical protein
MCCAVLKLAVTKRMLWCHRVESYLVLKYNYSIFNFCNKLHEPKIENRPICIKFHKFCNQFGV